jgi:hypothetical protein
MYLAWVLKEGSIVLGRTRGIRCRSGWKLRWAGMRAEHWKEELLGRKSCGLRWNGLAQIM